MNSKNDFAGLNFRRRLSRINQRMLIFIGSLLIFLLVWWILPSDFIFMILLFIVPTLVWVASFGWRTALNQVIRYLDRFLIN